MTLYIFILYICVNKRGNRDTLSSPLKLNIMLLIDFFSMAYLNKKCMYVRLENDRVRINVGEYAAYFSIEAYDYFVQNFREMNDRIIKCIY